MLKRTDNFRIPTTRGLLALAGALLPAACQSAPQKPRPITIAREAFAGEALYHGTLGIRHGCIVAPGNRSHVTVLFDPGVVLSSSGDGLFEPRTRNAIHFGHPIQGSGGYLRENGRGLVDLGYRAFLWC